MNANDIIEKCAEICDRYALKNHEAAVKAGRRASRLLEIDSAQRETAEIGSVECEAAALEAVAIADAIRALKSTYAPGMTDMMVSPESLDEFMAANPLPDEKDSRMTSEQIKHLVDRFLQWRLPEDFNPDNGISYKRPNYAAEVDATPSGTNLFDAAQATDMVRFMVEGMPASSLPDEAVSEAMVEAAQIIPDDEVEKYLAIARRDDWHNRLCSSDIRLLIGDLKRARTALAHADDWWRPIENAPKDGKAFLASSGGWLTLACWNKHRNGWCCVAPGYPNFPFDEQPTHFMSLQALPAPPKEGRQ